MGVGIGVAHRNNAFQSTILHAHTALAHASFADEAPYEWTGPCSSHIYYGKKGRRERAREREKKRGSDEMNSVNVG